MKTFSLKKSPENGGGQNITPLDFGTFIAEKCCFGLVLKMIAELRVHVVDFFPFNLAFNHIDFSIVCVASLSEEISDRLLINRSMVNH